MKKIIIVYTFISIIFTVYLVIHIDQNKYLNYYRLLSKFEEDIQIEDFNYIINNYKHKNSSVVEIKNINNRENLIYLYNFPPVNLRHFNGDSLKYGAQHPTVQLFLYSMVYNLDYFMKNLEEGNYKIPDKVYATIKNNYLIFDEVINSLPSFNPIAFNDHVISDRIIFLIVFYSYIIKNHPDEEYLISTIQNDIKQCIYFLKNDKFFNSKTNHGLMQIRALTLVYRFIKNDALKAEINKIINERLNKTLNYFSGEDGAIYEGSSGYWKLIYDLYEEIIKYHSDHRKINSVVKRLEKMKKFLKDVSYNNGFIQGSGDSYSSFLDTSMINISSAELNLYSNKLAVAKWSKDSVICGFHFLSLDTPPHVHKLPEDLAFFLYIDKQIFLNSGNYSYDKSDIRKEMINSDSYHGVTYLPKKNKILRSNLDFNRSKNDFVLSGYKIYDDGSKIIRIIKYRLGEDIINVQDKSENNEVVTSKFIINPIYSIDFLNKKEVSVNLGLKQLIRMKSNEEFKIEKIIFPVSQNKTDTVISLFCTGKENNIQVNLPFQLPTSFYTQISSYTNKRDTVSKILNKRWPGYKEFNSYDLLQIILVYISCSILYFILAVFSQKYIKSFKK